RLRADKAYLRRVLMIGGVALVAAVTLIVYLTSGRYVSTDDSYVKAQKLMVSTDVSGLVKDVDVHQGQHVKKGDILFRLDPVPFQIAVNDAKAKLEQTRLDVAAMKESYQQELSEINVQKDQVDLARRNYLRYASLLKQNAIAQSTYDQARLTYSAAQNQLSALQSSAKTQLAKLNGDPDIAPEDTPAFMQAKGVLDEAERQLDHATVRAPFDGVVAEVDSLQPGMLIISAMSAFTTTSAVGLVGTRDVWIEAHLKETDLTYVRKDQPVSITVDTYPGHTWHGHVDAISPVTGSAFSALPAENASGNWVKVVQRVPVRIAIDYRKGDPILRGGMSTVVDIDTGHRRWWRMLFGN
ncbi:MAG TPA: HlyD family secretion protein, partial [Rhizomicrobium sp.]|nr:HlyD family secretion protein [Rhizomicrobium sp.]